MSLEEKIEKVDKLTKSSKSTVYGIDGAEEMTRMTPNKERFDSLLHAQESQKAGIVEKPDLDPKRGSLLDEVRSVGLKVDKLKAVTHKDIVAQADGVVKQIEEIKKKLASPDVRLGKSTQSLLENKLSHVDENLRVALSKAGLEYKDYIHPDGGKANPIERFLGFLTHGQAQLSSLSYEVNQMHLNRKELSPVNMLRIQMKVGYITQEIEFFTAVLNKSLDSTKTVMNVQV